MKESKTCPEHGEYETTLYAAKLYEGRGSSHLNWTPCPGCAPANISHPGADLVLNAINWQVAEYEKLTGKQRDKFDLADWRALVELKEPKAKKRGRPRGPSKAAKEEPPRQKRDYPEPQYLLEWFDRRRKELERDRVFESRLLGFCIDFEDGRQQNLSKVRISWLLLGLMSRAPLPHLIHLEVLRPQPPPGDLVYPIGKLDLLGAFMELYPTGLFSFELLKLGAELAAARARKPLHEALMAALSRPGAEEKLKRRAEDIFSDWHSDPDAGQGNCPRPPKVDAKSPPDRLKEEAIIRRIVARDCPHLAAADFEKSVNSLHTELWRARRQP